ncbi:peptidase [Rhizocola hellebori]|uniref:Peptidase n=1 Tax=Rhizocola hellebori TaxID=1392758 RepID=A0A8J3VBW4_9ACTN|nr:prolyl oligopeptidase family serine peptidase [Rhizocola hellebori]GIH02034.1 peptidase [Rhizocola hellebori]
MSTTSLPRQLVRTRSFTTGTPSSFTIGPDGQRVLFLRSPGGDELAGCLWELDLSSGKERLLADASVLLGGATEELPPEERVRRERSRQQGRGIVDYSTDRDLRVAAFALSGDVWVVDTGSGAARAVTSHGSVVDPRLDPTGQRVAYVSGGALHVAELDGTADRVIAEPDGDEVTYGLAEHVAGESMARHHGYWWSPDGQRLLVSRVDNAGVDVWYITDPAAPAQAPRAVRYPAVGSANAEVTLWVYGLDGARAEVTWDRAAFEYVAVAGWDQHGPFTAVQSRDQQEVRTLGIDADNGTTTLLARQLDDCWVHLTPGLPGRTGSGALVGHADLGETRHLTVAGETVTPQGLQLVEVLGIDGEAILFVGTADPTERHLWLYEAEHGLRRLSDEPGVYTGAYRAGTLVCVKRTPASPQRITTAGPVGAPGVEVGAFRHEPVQALRVSTLVLGERQLRAQLFLPSWHEPGSGKLPVLMDPYGGPASAKVLAAQAPWSFRSQWFAEQGFAVLVIDGSGTPGRGPAWEREVYGDVFSAVLDDQVSGLEQAALLNSDLDLGRVGIRGWSYGGSLAALAVLRRPDVFHAAVAGAAVTDKRLYDTHWNERYLGHPDRFPERYDACSLLLDAPKLTRPLLLVHGLADDNVFPANSLQLSGALVAAGRPHEMLPLSGITHMAGNEVIAENLMLHELDFLRRSLPS